MLASQGHRVPVYQICLVHEVRLLKSHLCVCELWLQSQIERMEKHAVRH